MSDSDVIDAAYMCTQVLGYTVSGEDAQNFELLHHLLCMAYTNGKQPGNFITGFVYCLPSEASYPEEMGILEYVFDDGKE